MSEMTFKTAEEQPIDELVGWVKQHDFSLNLPPELLSIFDCYRSAKAMKGSMKS